MTLELKAYDIEDQPDEDSYETPDDLYKRLESQYGMFFQLDAAATLENKKCESYIPNAMFNGWGFGVDVWCNPPHSMNEEFIRRADAQHKKHNINIVMIIPANVIGTKAWHELIENETITITENHPLKGRPNFLKLGRKTKHPSRNSYVIIVWRKDEHSLNT